MSLICDYIRSNPRWIEELTSFPYNLVAIREFRFVKFKIPHWNGGNWSEGDLEEEAKNGIVVDLRNMSPVCWNAPEEVEKEVGPNIIYVWRDYEDDWHISDRINILSPFRERILKDSGLNFSTLNPDYVHVYQLIHGDILELRKIGVIDQKTGEYERR